MMNYAYFPKEEEPIEISAFELRMCQLQIQMFKIKWVCNI